MIAPSPRLYSLGRGLLVGVAALWLAACDAVVEVNATANVPARYSSVLVTVNEVWFNPDASAAPSDETWEKFRLDQSRTLDLTRLNGTTATLASELVVPAGRYRQMRLVLAGTHDSLRDSADDLDATYNNEVTWFDDDGEEWISPLEVLNAEAGIGLVLDLKVVEAAVALGGGSSRNAVQLVFDAARDLTEFQVSGRSSFLLNPTPAAWNEDEVGAIRGTLDLSRVTRDSVGTGRPVIQVTAQKLDRSAGRRVVVGSAAVGRNGAFTLYPLPVDEGRSTTEYDLVIHGPQVQTLILRDVPVSPGAPDAAQPITAPLLVLEPAEQFEANLAEAAPLSPRGARVGFYQTLPGDDAPYLIATAGVDPLSGRFVQPVKLSRAARVAHARYGSSSSLRTDPPGEGAGRFAIAAVSPHFGHGAFAAETLRPPSSASDIAAFTVPAIAIPSGQVAGTVSATVTVTTPGRDDRGALVVTREGAVVAVASLDAVLQQSLGSTFVDVGQVPAGSVAAPLASGLYHLEAWSWRAADPAGTFVRTAGAAAVDLRATEAAGGAVTIP